MKRLFTLLFFLVQSLFSFAQINVGNNQTICLNDTAQIIATISGSSGWTTGSPILITECDPGAPDLLEIQNVSAGPVNVTGWRVIISNNYTNINLANANEQVLSGTMAPGATQYWTDATTNNYWGSNMMWNPGAYPSFTTWIMILDDNNNVMDVFVGNWLAANIASSSITTSVGTISLAGHWNGDGVNQSTIGTSLQSFSRIGSNDNDDASDFSIMATSGGTTNNGINLPFSSGGAAWYDVNTGQMIGIGDTLFYAPSQTTFVAGVVTDSTGQVFSDTMRINVLNTQISTTGLSLCNNGTVTLTAPSSSFAYYMWNTNYPLQNLTVNTPGTYYVNCTTTNGNMTCQSPPITIYADTIPISVTPADTTLVCPGDTIYLEAPSGYSSYLWNTGSTAQSILADSTGSYWFSALDANNCVAVSDTAHVVTNELHPDIWSDVLSICSGGPVIILNRIHTDPIYQSYQWGTNTTLVPSTLPDQAGTQAGDYWVTVTDQFGCSGTSDTITIFSGNFSFDLLPADSVFLCNAGSSVTLDAANTMNVASYQWNTGATTPTITTNSPGTYYCITMTTTGCYGYSDTVTVSGITPQLTYSGLSLCAGPVSLNTGSYDIYQWSNNTYTQAINVNIAGDYYVFVTDSNGCTAYSDTVTIYTDTFQYNIIPSGSTTICSGYTVDLDAGNQFTGHLWNTGANISTITASTIGQYYATMIDVNGCTGYTDTIYVTNMSVNLTTTGYSLCNPQAYPVLDAGLGYYIYNWSNGDTVSSITATVPGNYYVTVIDENGCTASSDTIGIYLNQFTFNINSIGTDSLCQPGGQVTLDAGSGFFSYNWSSGANTQQTTVNATGNYTANVMDMNGCNGTSIFTVHNVVLTSSITGLNNVMQNNVENYYVTQNSTSTYNWGATGGILQSGLGTNSVDVLWNIAGQGSIYVIETDVNGCIGDTISLVVTVFQSTGITENQSQQISIYPNPSRDIFNITFTTEQKQNLRVRILNIIGEEVYKEDLQQFIGEYTKQIDLKENPKAIYFLEIETDNGVINKKLILQ